MHVLHFAILREEAAAPEGIEKTIKEEDRLSGGGDSAQYDRDEIGLFVCREGGVLSCLRVDRRNHVEAGPVSLEFVDRLAHGGAIGIFDGVEQNGESAINE